MTKHSLLHRNIVKILAILLIADAALMPAGAASISVFGQCSAGRRLAVEELVDQIEGKPYIQIRRQIISQGWTVAPMAETSGWRKINGNTQDVPSNGQEQPFIEKKFYELVACAEDQNDPCKFLFQDSEKDRLQISTLGEESPWSHAVVQPTALLACLPGKLPE